MGIALVLTRSPKESAGLDASGFVSIDFGHSLAQPPPAKVARLVDGHYFSTIAAVEASDAGFLPPSPPEIEKLMRERLK